MSRATREQSAATERRVRTLARELFAERGYSDVGVEQIAVAAGVTRGAVYHHFADKRALFEAVFGDAQAMIADAVATAAPGDGWQAIIDGSIAFVHAAVDPGVRRIVLIDGPAVLGWDHWRRTDSENSAVLLGEGLNALDDLAVDAAAAAALLSGAMNEGALWVAAGGDPAFIDAGLVRLISSLRVAAQDDGG